MFKFLKNGAKPSVKKPWPKWLKMVLMIVVAVLLVVGFVGIVLWQTGYLDTLKVAYKMKQQQNLAVEDKVILAQLKKIILLPEDIAPTMAIVSDAEALKKSQPAFFANAVNGNRLIIYPEMAILYDANEKKIIKVGPVQLPAVEPVNFAIYNSLKNDPDNLKTAELETKLKTAFNNAVVTVKADSTGVDYPKTLVIDVVGNNPDLEKIAQAVGGQVSALPEGEKKPEGVAVLLIIGKE